MKLLEHGARVGLIAEGGHDLQVVADWVRRLLRPDLRLHEDDFRRLAP